MGNLFINLPLPVGFGPGASVDVSATGAAKTFVVEGVFNRCLWTVEASADGGVTWAPVAGFQSGAAETTLLVAAQFMRVNVSGPTGASFSGSIGFGANDSGAISAALPLPLLNGPGTAVASSTFGSFMSFVAGGTFPGASIQVQASEDGSDWATVVSFGGRGSLQSSNVTAQFLRAVVAGRRAGAAFSGSLAVSACPPPGGGGGAGSGDPNTQAYFGPAGTLTDDPDATMTLLNWQLNGSGGGPQAARVRRDIQSASFGGGSNSIGQDSFSAGNGCLAGTNGASAFGEGAQALNYASHATGQGTIASGGNSAAHNRATTAAGDSAFACGNGGVAAGDDSFVANHGCSAGTTSCATGQTTTAPGNQCFSMGRVTNAAGDSCLAGGVQSGTGGIACMAYGWQCDVNANSAVAVGRRAQARRDGQLSHSSGEGALGPGSGPGDTQASVVTMSGTTPGVGAGETTELVLGPDPGGPLILEDGKAYTIVVTAVMRGFQGAVFTMQSSKQMFAVHRPVAGTSVIAASGALEQIGDAISNTWSLVMTIGAAPDRVVLTFSTGATTARCGVTAKVEFVEILRT